MILSNRNYVRISFLILFFLSAGLSLFKPTINSGLIAILSLVGATLFEAIEAYKRPEYKDFSDEVEEINKRLTSVEKVSQEIKSDHSAVKLGATFNRR